MMKNISFLSKCNKIDGFTYKNDKDMIQLIYQIMTELEVFQKSNDVCTLYNINTITMIIIVFIHLIYMVYSHMQINHLKNENKTFKKDICMMKEDVIILSSKSESNNIDIHKIYNNITTLDSSVIVLNNTVKSNSDNIEKIKDRFVFWSEEDVEKYEYMFNETPAFKIYKERYPELTYMKIVKSIDIYNMVTHFPKIIDELSCHQYDFKINIENVIFPDTMKNAENKLNYNIDKIFSMKTDKIYNVHKDNCCDIQKYIKAYNNKFDINNCYYGYGKDYTPKIIKNICGINYSSIQYIENNTEIFKKEKIKTIYMSSIDNDVSHINFIVSRVE
jgi:hypothetical protein